MAFSQKPPLNASLQILSESSPALVPSFGCGPKLIIFIVEDEPAIQDLLAGALAQYNFQIEKYRNAKAALVGLKRTRPQLIFLDVSLEGSDAIEVMRGLGAAKYGGKVQLVSGKDPRTLRDIQLVGERHMLSMLPPLQKPFRIQAVRQIIEDNLAELARVPEAAPDKPIDISYQKLPLNEVLQNNWFQLWYQPKIDIQRMKPVGAEGLVRCIHPAFGEVRPASFMPGASEADLIKLSERVLVQAIYDWPLFNSLGIPFKLAINMPVAALLRIPIARVVRELRSKDGNWPGLIIEITEDQAIKDIHAVHEIATQLKLYDVSISIDDFGAGYSHLARLKELPFEELKIDRGLVSKCDQDEHTATLCRTAIELAHKFETVAVAEGIEHTSELRKLQEMGCDLAQGYLFAPATPRDKLIESMRKRLVAARARA